MVIHKYIFGNGGRVGDKGGGGVYRVYAPEASSHASTPTACKSCTCSSQVLCTSSNIKPDAFDGTSSRDLVLLTGGAQLFVGLDVADLTAICTFALRRSSLFLDFAGLRWTAGSGWGCAVVAWAGRIGGGFWRVSAGNAFRLLATKPTIHVSFEAGEFGAKAAQW